MHMTYTTHRTYCLRASGRRAGFTLIEIVVTLGILSALFALGLLVSLDAYRATMSRSERDTIVAIVERARSHAVYNSSQSAWGACLLGGQYVIFRGTDCAVTSTSEQYPANAAAQPAFSNPVTFEALSGR